MSRIAFRNFTGGEVTPTLCARYDLKKFGSFLQTCRNFVPNLHGDVERRPGTKFIADLGANSILIPFQFNTEPSNNYVLIFQSGTIKIAQADGLIAATLSNPYSMSDVYSLSFAQVADVLYIAHPKYALRKITRSGSIPYDWDISVVPFNKSLDPPTAPTVVFQRGTGTGSTDNENYTLQYVVTSLDDDGVESIASTVGSAVGRFPTDWISGDKVRIRWPLVSGAKEYNIYRESAGYFGFIGTTSDFVTVGEVVSGIVVNGVTWPKGGNYYMSQFDAYSPADPGEEPVYLYSYYYVQSGGTHPVFEKPGGGEFFVWYAERDYWYLVSGDVDLDAEFDEEDIVQWVGTRDGNAPTGIQAGKTVTAEYSSGQRWGQFYDENFEPDTGHTPRENWFPFANGNHPAAVCFHQQRMWLGGTKTNPAAIYASRTGDYESFRKSRPLMDDDPLEYTLASGSVDEVKWLASFGDLIIGTAGAEYKATASKGAAITPSDCQITVQSYWGSKDLQPLIIGQSIMHCQRSGSHVRDLYYTLESDGYSGNDLSVLSPQLVESNSIVQWCYQQSPSSCVWAVRDDGTLLCLTYMKEQNVFGWSRHVTDGKVKSVAVINGEDEDVVMMVVQRTINGATKFYLERLMPRFKDNNSISEAWYVDAGMYVTPTVDENNRRVVCSGLTHLAGKTVSVLSDGSPEEHVVSSSGTFNLDFPLAEGKTALVGLGYVSAMCPLPMETDMQQTGTTLGKRRAYGKCVIRMYRSVGGAYAASKLDGMWDADGWKNVDWYELPFLPEKWGEACQPYSGDLEISLPAGQDPDTTIWVKQDKPLPLRVVSIMCEVHFGEA